MPTLPEIVLAFVDDLPMEQVDVLAGRLESETGLNWERLRMLLGTVVAQVETQEKLRVFLRDWQALPNPPLPSDMAHLLQTAAFALHYQRQQQRVELTWTGPKSERSSSVHIPLRRTDQALLELITAAQDRIIVVSFAVYQARAILSALEQAAQRGVEIIIIIESPDESEGRMAYDTLAALGAALRSCARIYVWPRSKRPISPDGKVGSLHAKVAVADGRRLFLSSANLTDYAMSLNMEMGVLLNGGEMPRQVDAHFEQLIQAGILNIVE